MSKAISRAFNYKLIFNLDNEVERIFSFKINPNDLVNEKYHLADQLGAARGDGVILISFPSLIVLNANKNQLSFLESPYNEKAYSIGRKFNEISSEYSFRHFGIIKDHIINTGNPYYIEEILINSKFLGEEYWNITAVPLLENEKIKYIIISFSNATEKVLNMRTIKQKNKEQEAIIENISDEIIIFDKYFNIAISNQELIRGISVKNLPVENLCKINNLTIFFDKDDQLIPFENLPFQRVAKGGFIEDYFMKAKSSSGLIYTEVSGSPLYDSDGKLNGGVMIYKDIKDRIKAEEAKLIRIQKTLMTKVVEALGLEFVRCTYPELEIISINNGIKTSVSPIGKSYFTISPIDEKTKRKELDLYLVEKGQLSYVDYANYMVKGEQRFFKTVNQSILGLDHKVIEVIFITIDITDEVKARNKMQEALEMQNQVFASIPHELKTPLSIILSASQLIEMYLKKEANEINKEGIKKSIDIIKHNGYRFTKLINNIIDLSSIESGFFGLDYRNKNIVKIVEDIIDSVRVYVENRGLHIILGTELKEKIMALDVDKIERILLNLISNAVKFSDKNGKIDIKIKNKGNFVEIVVRDYGIGIDKEHLNIIFEKYEKIDNSLSRNAEGTGKGLALVKTMVGLIDGEINVESELGRGSLFTVRLPVKVVDESEDIKIMETSSNLEKQINIEFLDVYSK